MAKKAAGKKPLNKTEILTSLADSTGLSKKEVQGVLDGLSGLIAESLSKRGAGAFNLPGLCKVFVHKKPARKAQKGVPNPFRPGETMDVAAKPAENVIKVRPLKALKDMAPK